jgi:hypothetical protein
MEWEIRVKPTAILLRRILKRLKLAAEVFSQLLTSKTEHTDGTVNHGAQDHHGAWTVVTWLPASLCGLANLVGVRETHGEFSMDDAIIMWVAFESEELQVDIENAVEEGADDGEEDVAAWEDE